MTSARAAPLVLVTRAEEDGRRTAAALEAMGFRPLVAPLIATRATGAAPPPGPFDAVLVTSAKAAAFLAEAPVDVAAVPVFAVGPRTAEAARAAGARDVRIAEGDAASLARLVSASLSQGARLLHVAGEDRKPEPAESLARAGCEVVAWSAYRAAPAPLPQAARAAIASGAAGGALHYSRRSAELLVAALEQAGLVDRLPQLVHASISPDAADPLRKAGATRVFVAPRPEESALLRTFADAASVAFGAEWPAVR